MNLAQIKRSLPVVVATDGRRESDSALLVGHLLAGPSDRIRVVAASERSQLESSSAQTAFVSNVLAQLDRVGARRDGVDMLDGDPPAVIARVARDANASMIVCGLGDHDEGNYPFRDETTLRLVRRANAPVLATAPDMHHAPRRIVVAMDFSETSMNAARWAMRIAGLGAVVNLVHVQPRDVDIRTRTADAIRELFDESDRGNEPPAFDPHAALGQIRAELDAPPGMTVRRLVLQGDPATELLAYASGINADLIAAGSNGTGFVSRMLVGRVASRIVRHSRRSILIVPPAAMMQHALTA